MRRLVSAVSTATLAALALWSPVAHAEPQVYQVGAAVRDISPIGRGLINVGGNGFGDGTHPLSQLIGPGGERQFEGEHIAARAVVIDDGTTAVALATVETQGMFAAYERGGGTWGLHDIATRVAADVPRLPVSNIVIANDHTHSGPDAIGAWGFVPDDYMAFIAAQTVEAIKAAYAARRDATLVAGASDASDIIYTQTCTEALNQPAIPQACDPFMDTKDGLVRVLQARDPETNAVVLTLLSFGAHATLGGGGGVHGDWPQFMSERLTAEFGGIGIAMEGTNGRIQPCRPRCFFTTTPDGGAGSNRKLAYTNMLMHHVNLALASASSVAGPVASAKSFIKHEVENPALAALLLQGEAVGAKIERSRQAPWLVGNLVRTVVSAVRVGNLLVSGAPGEPYPNIPHGVEAALGMPGANHWTLALADDQLGYLIAPVEGYAPVASQVAVNDNALFNISPTVGDHVMCAQIRLAGAVGFTGDPLDTNPRCPAWDVFDLATSAAV